MLEMKTMWIVIVYLSGVRNCYERARNEKSVWNKEIEIQLFFFSP